MKKKVFPLFILFVLLIFFVSCAEKPADTKVAELEKTIAQLKQENDLLKKWQRYLAEAHQNDLDSSRDTEKRSK